jgi:methylenetetrahydrofolate dehydrogenase (NADP+)/methenyltetrahydrofolate cyclohydrolase
VLTVRTGVTTATLLEGEEVADAVRADVRAALDALRDHGATPTIGTVLMSDDDAQRAFMDRKHGLCSEQGIATERIDVDPDAPADDCYEAVDQLAADGDVTALFVQAPLPEHVDAGRVRARVPAAKDVDCFNPANLGRLVRGDPRVTPVTPAAVRRLLAEYDVRTVGQDVVVVGRSDAIGKPLANMLLARGPGGDATVTVCHTATQDLAAKTRAADVLVTAAGVPRLVDASLVSPGATVVDISVNRVEAAGSDEYDLVGDVAFERVREKAGRITPVPGGVGPVTLAMLLRNVVDVTARQAAVDVALCGE